VLSLWNLVVEKVKFGLFLIEHHFSLSCVGNWR